MRTEELLDAIGDVKDAYVSDLLEQRRPNRLRPWMVLTAACLAAVLVLSLGSLGFNAGTGGDGDSYFYYAGPVLPLSVRGDSTGLSAVRSVWLDFAAYDPGSGDHGHRLRVTDTYGLTNEGNTDRTVTLLYPYIKQRPIISVDGEAVPATIHPGAYAGGFEGAWGDDEVPDGTCNLDLPDSFRDYQRLLSETGYMTDAFDGFPELDLPAYVYRLHDFTGTQEDAERPVLAMEFSVEPGQSWVFTDNINGGSSDPESGHYVRFRRKAEPGEEDSFVVIVGGDLKEYAVRGYRTKDRAPGEELADLGCTVTRYESTLEDVLRYFLRKYWGSEMERMDESRRYALPAEDLYLGLAAEHLLKWGPLSDHCAERYEDGRLITVLTESHAADRVCWLFFDVTIPAGGTLTVQAVTEKEASSAMGHGSGIGAYELATTLGSNLRFTSQTAVIGNTDGIELLSQNFSFDTESGITSVELDPNEPYYWLKVQCRAHR